MKALATLSPAPFLNVTAVERQGDTGTGGRLPDRPLAPCNREAQNPAGTSGTSYMRSMVKTHLPIRHAAPERDRWKRGSASDYPARTVAEQRRFRS